DGAWETLGSTDEEVPTSMAVVEIDGKDFLIIGTEENGYLEVDISGTLADISDSDITSPTLSTADTSNFSSKYPSLADAYIYDVHAGSDPGVFYLATEEGLWKRNPDHGADEPMFDKM
ncbi:MAG: hypothetical protein ACLFSA_05215, partial [Spirochaetaceae bacterium]